jgi:hypothetical protein
MITIKLFGVEANLENEKWTCKDKTIKKMLKTFNYESLKYYAPFKDLALAELVVKEFKGEIIKVTDEPEFVDGRIY